MTAYELSRAYWNFAFENPEKVSPNHAAIYFFAIEHCNRLGWRDKFGFPTQMAMDAVGIKRHGTYIKYFKDLTEWGFFKVIEKSQNQYSANIISLQSAVPKNAKALDKAMINHATKQPQSNRQSNCESNGSIDKQITNNQITTNNSSNSEKLFIKISDEEKEIDEVRKLFEADVGLKMSWGQKGFPGEKFSEGIEQWMILHNSKGYEDFVKARKHFLFWIPNWSSNLNIKKTPVNASSSKQQSRSSFISGAIEDFERLTATGTEGL